MSIKFFKIENTNIKLNNIKQYGISYEEKPEPSYSSSELSSLSSLLIGTIVCAAALCLFGKNKDKNKDKDKDNKNYYMYITTYQNDNFKFYGDKKYLENKLSELDDLMTSN